MTYSVISSLVLSRHLQTCLGCSFRPPQQASCSSNDVKRLWLRSLSSSFQTGMVISSLDWWPLAPRTEVMLQTFEARAMRKCKLNRQSDKISIKCNNKRKKRCPEKLKYNPAACALPHVTSPAKYPPRCYVSFQVPGVRETAWWTKGPPSSTKKGPHGALVQLEVVKEKWSPNSCKSKFLFFHIFAHVSASLQPISY